MDKILAVGILGISAVGALWLTVDAIRVRMVVKRSLQQRQELQRTRRERLDRISTRIVRADPSLLPGLAETEASEDVAKIVASVLTSERQLERGYHLVQSKDKGAVTVAADLLCSLGDADAAAVLDDASSRWGRDLVTQDYLRAAAKRLRAQLAHD